MKKYIIPLLLLIPIGIVFYRCTNTTHAAIVKVAKSNLDSSKLKIIDALDLCELIKNENNSTSGFFGKNNERIAIYIKTAKQDADEKAVIHVKGLNTLRKNITPFEGDFTIENIEPFITKGEAKKNYSVTGKWQFVEDVSYKNSGIFKGKFAMDLTADDNNKFYISTYAIGGKAKNNGFLINGNWTSNTNPNDSKQVTFTQNIDEMGNKIFKHFSYGERESVIDEKYAKYGWSDEYLYEEWWLTDAEKKAKELADKN
jgi:hypothetical protein